VSKQKRSASEAVIEAEEQSRLTARSLEKYAWLSIGAAVATIGLKLFAAKLTGSVGLLSDAAESVVNLVAAIIVLAALRIASRPADEDHHYGHGKVEYFSAFIEGAMIFVASAIILYTAVQRFLHPQPLESLGVGLIIIMIATGINFFVGRLLIRTGRQKRSITLEADGKHLMTDVWTSIGVVIGVGLVGLTGWERLDSIIAFLVGLNIVWTGSQLLLRSTRGLMDKALPKQDNDLIVGILEKFKTDQVSFHGLLTRESGHHRFISMHVLVPGSWTVQQAHDLSEEVEAAIEMALPDAQIITHVEPTEDERSYDDVTGGTLGSQKPTTF
jgi:cation diffusion facilitator family transporter